MADRAKMEQSVELGVAMLRSLAVGSAYAPLDPGDPQERFAFMMEDATVITAIAAPYTAPRNDVGEILSGLWAEVQGERRSHV